MSKHSEFGKGKRKNIGKMITIMKMNYKVVEFLFFSFVSSTINCMIVFTFSMHVCMKRHRLISKLQHGAVPL